MSVYLRAANAIVESLDLAELPCKRLKSLGVFEGQLIELSKRGNPMIIKAAGSRVAISQQLAEQIMVRDVEDGQ